MKPSPSRQWQPLGTCAPETLIDARLQLHHAAQIVASVGFTYVDPAPDFSHTNMEWFANLGALASNPASGEKPFRAVLRFADLALLLLDRDRAVVDEFPLEGRTIDQGYQWLAASIESIKGEPPAKPLFRPEHELPSHPVAQGAKFSRGASPPYQELARWYADADLVLRKLRAETRDASPVRCWPHHFDIATLIEVERGADGNATKAIGVGMTPGDEYYPEPYWYVTPWPRPEGSQLPPLKGNGQWRAEDWFGAVLPASRLPSEPADQQARLVSDFTRSAVAAGLKLLKAGG